MELKGAPGSSRARLRLMTNPASRGLRHRRRLSRRVERHENQSLNGAAKPRPAPDFRGCRRCQQPQARPATDRAGLFPFEIILMASSRPFLRKKDACRICDRKTDPKSKNMMETAGRWKACRIAAASVQPAAGITSVSGGEQDYVFEFPNR